MSATGTRRHTSSRRPSPGSGRRASVELVSDGVVAGYIHDISRRRRRPLVAPRLSRGPDIIGSAPSSARSSATMSSPGDAVAAA